MIMHKKIKHITACEIYVTVDVTERKTNRHFEISKRFSCTGYSAKSFECEIVYYHIGLAAMIITGIRIQYMIHEIQYHTALREYIR